MTEENQVIETGDGKRGMCLREDRISTRFEIFAHTKMNESHNTGLRVNGDQPAASLRKHDRVSQVVELVPPWQRRGLGQLLIASSYVLGRREGRFGGPEKPLSAKGLKGYLAYWCREVARFIVEAPSKKTVSVKSISEGTWIMPEDVVAALKEMGCLEGRKTASGNLVVNKSKVIKWAEEHRVVLRPVVDVEAFVEEESELSEVEDSSEAEESA